MAATAEGGFFMVVGAGGVLTRQIAVALADMCPDLRHEAHCSDRLLDEAEIIGIVDGAGWLDQGYDITCPQARWFTQRCRKRRSRCCGQRGCSGCDGSKEGPARRHDVSLGQT